MSIVGISKEADKKLGACVVGIIAKNVSVVGDEFWREKNAKAAAAASVADFITFLFLPEFATSIGRKSQ